MQSGIRASKICGAGESGFMLCLMNPDERAHVKRKIREITGKEVLQIGLSELGVQSKLL
jgi:galactokinase/mevalonate kinase-like predicted kinase